MTVTGATGLIGRALVPRCASAAREVTVLTRDPARARARGSASGARRSRWDPLREPAPAEALAGRDAVVHLAGEPVAQRWSATRQARDPRQPRARHAQPDRGAARRATPAAARAR